MSALVSGRTGNWEIVIGMEVHAQVVSKAKLFSGSSAVFGDDGLVFFGSDDGSLRAVRYSSGEQVWELSP